MTDKEIKIVEDLPDDLTLITDSQEVKAVLDHIHPNRRQDIDWVFVDSEHGEYTKVWGGNGVVVYDNDYARRLK